MKWCLMMASRYEKSPPCISLHRPRLMYCSFVDGPPQLLFKYVHNIILVYV